MFIYRSVLYNYSLRHMSNELFNSVQIYYAYYIVRLIFLGIITNHLKYIIFCMQLGHRFDFRNKDNH